MKIKKAIIILIVYILILCCINIINKKSNNNIYADPVMGQPTPEDVLLIYIDDNGYNEEVALNMRDAIVSAGGNVTIVTVQPGDNDGIYDDLQAAGVNLDDYCEVWDVRFNPNHIGESYANGVYDDTITITGPNNDEELFRNFLSNGGHLYLQGEHQDFYGRNQSLLQFISDVSGAISYPGVVTTYKQWNSFNTTPEDIPHDFNTLTHLDTYYTGTILLSGVGRGRPITVDGTNALDLAFLPEDLSTGSGRMFVNFDTNEFSSDTNCPGGCYTANEEGYYIQNVYDFLSNCYKYTITKSVNPGTICVGDTATYQICYSNVGTRDLVNVTLWDTFPTCLSVVGASTPWTGNSGNMYWWDLGTVPIGASACIDVYVKADQIPPCP